MQMSMPRSNSRISTFRNGSAKRPYVIPTRIISGDELKRGKELGGLPLDLRLSLAGYHAGLRRWSDNTATFLFRRWTRVGISAIDELHAARCSRAVLSSAPNGPKQHFCHYYQVVVVNLLVPFQSKSHNRTACLGIFSLSRRVTRRPDLAV